MLGSRRLPFQQQEIAYRCITRRSRSVSLSAVHNSGEAALLNARQPVHQTINHISSSTAALSRRQLLLIGTSLSLWPTRLSAASPGNEKPLPIEQLKEILAYDFQEGQYYTTGQLTCGVFRDDCVFTDPTTRVVGVEKYSKAVAALFDTSQSRADIISMQVEDPHTITLRWRFAASLNVPGPFKPKLKPYTGTTHYVTDADGLVVEHTEDWDISALDAFVSILFPGFGAPAAPPVSSS